MTELSTEQAFAALEAVQQHTTDPRVIEPLRLALVRLQELECQPDPQRPTDEELHQLWLDLYAFHDGPTSGEVVEIARAVLDRWGGSAPCPYVVSSDEGTSYCKLAVQTADLLAKLTG